jgi:hypothetical protein
LAPLTSSYLRSCGGIVFYGDSSLSPTMVRAHANQEMTMDGGDDCPSRLDRIRSCRTMDLEEKRVVTTSYLIEEFVDLLAAHVPDRYRHAMRRFGLLAPRTQRTTSAALFLLLGQEKRPRPQRLSWRNSLRKLFRG